jgi:hypothetical protein
MISHNQLIPFLGQWDGYEQFEATPWSKVGRGHATLTIGPAPGSGPASESGGLILDYAQTRFGASMTGHGVLIGEQWWWFDSYGFTPASPGTATLSDDGWLVFERSSERGRNVTRLRVADRQLVQEIEAAMPADAPLTLMLRGTYSPNAVPDEI